MTAIDADPAKENDITVLHAFPKVQLEKSGPTPPRTARTQGVRPCVFVVLSLLLAGCQEPRSGLLEALQRDCEGGRVDACRMLESSGPADAEDDDIAPPVRSRDIVQAILAGMRQGQRQAAQSFQEQSSPLVEEPKPAP